MDRLGPEWQLSLETEEDGVQVLVARLGLREPSHLTVRVRGVEVLGDAHAPVIRLSPVHADVELHVDASRLPDPVVVAASMRMLRHRLRTGVASAAPPGPGR